MWKPAETTHEQLMAEWMKRPGFKKAYDDLEDEFRILDVAIQASKLKNAPGKRSLPP